jgi:hypothetical protein
VFAARFSRGGLVFFVLEIPIWNSIMFGALFDKVQRPLLSIEEVALLPA